MIVDSRPWEVVGTGDGSEAGTDVILEKKPCFRDKIVYYARNISNSWIKAHTHLCPSFPFLLFPVPKYKSYPLKGISSITNRLNQRLEEDSKPGKTSSNLLLMLLHADRREIQNPHY